MMMMNRKRRNDRKTTEDYFSNLEMDITIVDEKVKQGLSFGKKPESKPKNHSGKD